MLLKNKYDNEFLLKKGINYKYLRKEEGTMLKVTKLNAADKKTVKVEAQGKCDYTGKKGAHDCMYDCKTAGKDRWYKSQEL